ncbi:hypothetical protein E2P81_ATG07372 [Venturia nashicola]|uniref:Uncharacterized protein n=1 Tax=Venturia nashicola TaxID=86259 RepID=A0A4Z1NVC8_9PEZI|nr:hypothetical protein E6O75_ATG07527 [Venturia nashicola]TLD31882.1 hypothetical protein E2P81_ATG07372 [Venturia nashicola]
MQVDAQGLVSASGFTNSIQRALQLSNRYDALRGSTRSASQMDSAQSAICLTIEKHKETRRDLRSHPICAFTIMIAIRSEPAVGITVSAGGFSGKVTPWEGTFG